MNFVFFERNVREENMLHITGIMQVGSEMRKLNNYVKTSNSCLNFTV